MKNSQLKKWNLVKYLRGIRLWSGIVVVNYINQNLKPITMQDKIIAAIAAKLNDYDTLVSLYDVEEMAQSIAAAIAPLVQAGEVDWKDAPEWAEWRTVDKDRNVTFWEKEPLIVQSRGFWRQGNAGGQWEEQKYNNDWEKSLQRRPK